MPALQLRTGAQLPLSSLEQDRLRPILSRRIRGKKLLVCSGASDTLVPYTIGRPFLRVLKDAVGKDGWYVEGGVAVEDRVYAGVGHDFSSEIVRDAVNWLVETAAQGPGENRHRTCLPQAYRPSRASLTNRVKL